MFSVILSRRANKFLQGLEHKVRSKVVSSLEDLADYPFSLKRHDIKKIQGRDNTFRLRVGDLRAIFYIDKEEERVIILKIDYRESVLRVSSISQNGPPILTHLVSDAIN